MNIITNKEHARELRDVLANKVISFDFETTSLDWWDARILGMSIADINDEWYISLSDDFNETDLGDVLKGWFDQQSQILIAQNAKFDMHFLWRMGVHLPQSPIDTMGLAQLHNESTPLSLKKLAYYVFDRHPREWDKTFMDWPLEEVAVYACDDARNTFDLAAWFVGQLQSSPYWQYYTEYIRPLPAVGMKMEIDGWALDVPIVEDYGKQVEALVLDMVLDICSQNPGLEKPGSTQQVAEVLKNLGAAWIKGEKTPKGKLSTNVTVLERMIEECNPDVKAFALSILSYREQKKLLGTITGGRGLLARLGEDGRIHPNWKIFGTFTGRWACSKPNLQNIPKYRGDKDKELNPRDWFIADPGNLLVVSDLSQAELRVLAGLAQDERMIASFARGDDIHRASAAAAFRKSIEDITAEERYLGKNAINFPIVYGAGARSIAARVGLDEDAVDGFLRNFYAQHRAIVRWRENTMSQARLGGVVHTVAGRPRRPLLLKTEEMLFWPGLEDLEPGRDRMLLAGFDAELKKKDLSRWKLKLLTNDARARQIGHLKRRGERQAVNAVIQGSVGDIVNKALIELSSLAGVLIPAQIHDEVICETKEALAPNLAEVTTKTLRSNVGGVDISANTQITKRWGGE